MKKMIILALGLSVFLIVSPASAVFYLHGAGPNANPPTLFLDNTNPTATTAKYRDSTGVNFSVEIYGKRSVLGRLQPLVP